MTITEIFDRIEAAKEIADLSDLANDLQVAIEADQCDYDEACWIAIEIAVKAKKAHIDFLKAEAVA